MLPTSSNNLDLSVDRASEVPLGTQLAWKLRTLIVTGQLEAGARLPGIRELAERGGVNINTVRSVLMRLEDQGLLNSQQGRGTFVAENARSHARLAAAAGAAIIQAQAAGVDVRDLAAALYVSPRGSPTPAPQDDGMTSPQERLKLRQEIDRLELELAELEPLHHLEENVGAPEPRVLTAAELRDTRDALMNRIDQLHRQRLEWQLERRLAEPSESHERSYARRWRTGSWTGPATASVSWIST